MEEGEIEVGEMEEVVVKGGWNRWLCEVGGRIGCWEEVGLRET